MDVEQKSKQFRLLVFAASFIFLLIFNAIFLYTSFKNLSEQIQREEESSQFLNELDLLLSASKDAETGIRGYLLSEQEQFLATYRKGSMDAWVHLRRLETLAANTVQKGSVQGLERIVTKLFSILERALSENLGQGKRIELDILAENKATMDILRVQVNELKQEERRKLLLRREQTASSETTFYWTLFITAGASIIIIFFTFVQIARNQKRSAEELKLQAAMAQEKILLAEVSKVFTNHTTLMKISEKLIEFFVHQFGIIAGRLISLENGTFQIIGGYGSSASAHDISIKPDDKISNLLEAAIERQEIWQISDIPENYWQVTSSLGKATPSTLLLIPLVFQGNTIGLIELGSFKPISDELHEVLNKLRETISVGLNAAIYRASIQRLLEKTQQQAEELQSSEEELRVNNEELEQQARLLEKHQKGLDEKNKALIEAHAQLEERAQELELSSKYKSDFLAKMSHELRTPLNGLLILSTLLMENKEKNLSQQQLEFAKSINTAGNDLLALINDILDLAKIEARKLSLRPESFTLESLVNSERKIFEIQAQTKGLQFIIDLPEHLNETYLYTDRQRVEQILRNFLSNAIKFTEQGHIALKVGISEDKHKVCFTVSDSGIGIPEEKKHAIFEAFEQSDSSVSRKYGGTGLGLTISRELANLLGGEIELESVEGEGSKFKLTIPIEINSKNIASSSAKVTHPQPSPQEESKKLISGRVEQEVNQLLQQIPKDSKTILIVEDDVRFRGIISQTVRSYNFHPIEIGDGELAIALLNQYAPDAILLDIKLPGISGLGLLELIKQLAHLRHIPVHMISALNYQHRALRMGAMGYLTKPVTLEKVQAAMSRIEATLSKKVKQVLLIEDDSIQSQAVSELIGGEDIEVVSVSTGKEAIEKIKNNGFDCIILDLFLPDLSGEDLLRMLTSLDISLPPIIIYTGKDLTDDDEAFLGKYSESIIIKGVKSPERLLDEVNLFLHRIESALPSEKLELLTQLRSHEKAFEDKTILVVDDDIRNIFALTSALEAKNLKVLVARDGLEALQMVEEKPEIDLVLMDIMMPNMDGFEAIKRIRENSDEAIKNLPIIALTAKAMREDYEKCIEVGANDYLPKPINLTNLFTILKVWLTAENTYYDQH